MTFLAPHPTFFWGITAHSLAFLVAGLVAVVVVARTMQPVGLSLADSAERVFSIFLAGLVAARIGYVMSYPSTWTDTVQVVRIWEGGLVSYWGMAAGLALAYWYARRKPEQSARWWYAVVLAGLCAWAVGRWGNYYMAESQGVVSTVWSVTYGRVPIQLFESLTCIVLAFWLWRTSLPMDIAAYWAITSYFITRFFIDSWRDESVLFGLHNSQWISLIATLLLVTNWYVRTRRTVSHQS